MDNTTIKNILTIKKNFLYVYVEIVENKARNYGNSK